MFLTLGAAKFGNIYGLRSTRIEPFQIKSINNLIKKNNIKYFDTAISYGNGESEKLLSKINLKNLKIISKIKLKNNQKKNLQKWITNEVKNSLARLKKKNLYGMLIHDVKDLKKKNGKLFLKCLKKLKKQKLITKLGISIYAPSELDYIWKFWKPDIVQFPYNIFDQRIEKSGWLDKLKKNNVMTFARSCFLQGILLNKKLRLKKYHYEISQFKNWCLKFNLDPLVACINFVKKNKKIKSIVVVFSSSSQLK